MQAWYRPPLPKASPLPAKVTVTAEGAGGRVIPPLWSGDRAWRRLLIMTVSKPRIVVTHWVHPEVAGYLAGFSDALIPSPEQGVFSPGQVADLAADADGLIVCMADRVDDAFLARCPRLRVVSATLKGYDTFDAGACTRRGVWLTIVPDTIIAPTAEL